MKASERKAVVERFRKQFPIPIINGDFGVEGDVLNKEIEDFWLSELSIAEKRLYEKGKKDVKGKEVK